MLLLALVSYTPSDPSFNTVGGGAGTRLAHNWTGLVGAYVADLLLQTVGIAIFFVPLAMVRIGVSWMRSQRVGSTKMKLAGIAVWLVFAPALIALMPGEMLWRHALPIAGIEGTVLAGGLMHFVNYPGDDDSLWADGGAVAVPDDVISVGECGGVVYGALWVPAELERQVCGVEEQAARCGRWRV